MEKEAAVQAHEQWQGVVEAALPSTPASAAWPHIASFCALHRYMPGIDACELEEGEDGRPGCVRYVTLGLLAPGTTTGEARDWAREKLLEIDGDARRLSYSVVGSSMGISTYVASMSIVADDEEEAGCRLVWSFKCDPVQGWAGGRDWLLGVLNGEVKGIAAAIEEAHAAAAANTGGDNVVVAAA